MTLESYKFANPESILDKMRWEAAAEAKREAKRMEKIRKQKARKHAKQVKIAMKGK